MTAQTNAGPDPEQNPPEPGGPEEAQSDSFASLGLPEALLSRVTDLGYEAPTPIQAAAIPAMLTGVDLLCQAATGTGKTAAFALPILARLADERRSDAVAPKSSGPEALVLAPTRELCVQVAEAMHSYGRPLDAHTLPVYGGQPIGRQLRGLSRGVDIVVATPGRALDLINRGALRLDGVRTVVLDEADEMLDMGFAEDLEAILSAAPAQRQTVMFSATMPKRIQRIAATHLRAPRTIEIGRAELPGEQPAIRQVAHVVARQHKVAALCRVLDVESPTATLIFCRTRDETDRLAESLNGRGYRTEALHGGMDQAARDRVMGRLRNGHAELLVATDVAARGLDIDHLTHVVNFDVPAAAESYVHRIGRVGRGGRSGVAITIAEPRERRQLESISRVTGRRIEILPLPTSAELRTLRLESTRVHLLRMCADDDLDDYRDLVGRLGEDYAPDLITLAAVKMAHLATVGDEGESDIPDAPPPASKGKGRGEPPSRDTSRSKTKRGAKGADDRSDSPRARGARSDRRAPAEDGRPGKSAHGSSRLGPPKPGRERIFIAAGADAGMRPQDVVGAIAHETGLPGKQIGPIDIAPRFTLVDVPTDSAQRVLQALSHTRIKGKKVKVRRDRG